MDGETVETKTLFFGDSKITSDGDCSREIKDTGYGNTKILE